MARQETLEQLENPEWKIWLALRNGQLVSIQVYLPAQPPRGIGYVVLPEKCSFLGFAATREVDDESFLVIPGALDVDKNGLNVWMLFHTWLLSEHSA